MSLTEIAALVTGLVYPAYTLLTFRSVNRGIREKDKNRLADYRRTIFTFWLLTALILFDQFYGSDIILDFSLHFNTAGIILGILILLLLAFQFANLKIPESEVPALREKFRDTYFYLPKNLLERNWFIALSVSAGICEEIIFRLFLYEFAVQHMHLIPSIAVVNILFALTHIWSGPKNLAGSFLLGVIFSVIYYFTGNIWLAIVLHTGIDIQSGLLGYRLTRTRGKQ